MFQPRSGSASGSTGPSGASSAPVSPSSRIHSQASRNGSAAAPTQPSQRATGRCRRRAPKKPSKAVSSGGSSSVPTSSRIAQSGSSRLTVMIPDGSSANGPSSPARDTRPVERGDRPQRRAAERVDAVLRHLGVRLRPELARRLQQHGRQPGAGGLALLGHRQRQRAPRPLADRARAARLHADLAPHRALERAPHAHRRRLLAVGPRHDPRLARLAPGDVAEHDRGVDRVVGGVLRERPRARGARAAARGRDEHERGGQLADLEQPRHLEQRRRARQLGQRRRAERVAVRHHDDPAAREARAERPPPSRGLSSRGPSAPRSCGARRGSCWP